MPVVSSPLGLGSPTLASLPPDRNRAFFQDSAIRFSSSANISRFKPPTVSMRFRPMNLRRSPGLHAVGFGAPLQPSKNNRITYFSDRKNILIVCSAASSQGQTQTVTRETPTITKAPAHEKSPKLDDGGTGFPPRDDGGGGGGGGGGGDSSSGGFFLFGFLLFLGYLKDLEMDSESRSGRRR